MFDSLRTKVRRFFGHDNAADATGSAAPKRPKTIEMPTPGGEHRRRRPTTASDSRILEAAKYRDRRDMAAGSASTLKKAMRARRIENGTQGYDNMGAFEARRTRG